MFVPDKNFRMKKEFKTRLALMKCSKEERNAWKRMFIQAQLAEEAARRAYLKAKEPTTFSGKKSHSKEGVALD